MIKNNKIKVIISSVITALPIIAGLILWNKLPEELVTHWGINGEPDGWSSKPFAVFFLPLFLLAIHFICLFFSSFDKKNSNQNPKAIGIVFWICPMISLLTNAAVYATALGVDVNVPTIAPIIVGIMFLTIGNYMPKIKRNFTLGIKVPWTLADEEVWNKTHRLAGKLWVFGGIVMVPIAFLPPTVAFVALFAVLFVLVAVPTIYSYIIYKKKKTAR